MTARVTVDGINEVLKNFGRVSDSMLDAMDRAVVATASEVQREAITSINKQSPGKRVKRRGVTHVVSKPGDAPNTDTGRLVGSIAIRHLKKTAIAQVFTDLDYGLYLETVLNRPWLRPALMKKKDNLVPNLIDEIRRVQ